MPFTALQFSSNALYQPVNKVAHGFTEIGVVLRYDGVDFVAADATNEANSEIVGMLSFIESPDTYYISQIGKIDGLTVTPTEGGAFIPGTLYYLSQALGAGELTAIKPTTVGQVELPCFIALTADTGFFFTNVGDLIQSGALFNWTVVNANTVMAVNQGYIVNGGASINLQLPPVSAVGDIIKIATLGTNGCVIMQNTVTNSVNVVDVTSTVGAGGTVTLNATNGVLSGSCELLCMTANSAWKMTNGTGIWTPA